MPAKSVAQQQFMAICEHNPGHVRGACPDMTVKQMHDYASTSTKNLPKYVKKKGK